MKLRYIYEYRVRLLFDKAVRYGKLYVDVYSTVLKFSITYDGWEYPYIIDSLPLPKKIIADKYSVFELISKSLSGRYELINI